MNSAKAKPLRFLPVLWGNIFFAISRERSALGQICLREWAGHPKITPEMDFHSIPSEKNFADPREFRQGYTLAIFTHFGGKYFFCHISKKECARSNLTAEMGWASKNHPRDRFSFNSGIKKNFQGLVNSGKAKPLRFLPVLGGKFFFDISQKWCALGQI